MDTMSDGKFTEGERKLVAGLRVVDFWTILYLIFCLLWQRLVIVGDSLEAVDVDGDKN